MIVLRHSRSAETYMLMQTLRSWNGHCTYNLHDMRSFFRALIDARYNYRGPKPVDTLALLGEVYETLNNLFWGPAGCIQSPMSLAKLVVGTGKGIPLNTEDGSAYIVRPFTGAQFAPRIYDNFLGDTLAEFVNGPVITLGKYGIAPPKKYNDLIRYAKVASHFILLMRLSPHQSRVGTMEPVTSDIPEILYVGDVGARHNGDQIRRCISAIDTTITLPMWERIEQRFGRQLIPNLAAKHKEEKRKLHTTLRKFMPKIKSEEEFEQYVAM